MAEDLLAPEKMARSDGGEAQDERVRRDSCYHDLLMKAFVAVVHSPTFLSIMHLPQRLLDMQTVPLLILTC